MPDAADWVRLGRMLQVQRVTLNPRYKNRSLFSREKGINYRLAQDVETGARDNYEYATLAFIELAYGWKPGSIETVLRGGEPVVTPQPDPALTAREAAVAAAFPDAIRAGLERRSAGNGGAR